MTVPLFNEVSHPKPEPIENKRNNEIDNKKLDVIQVFRGFAAIFVVLHHITGAEWFYYKFRPFNNIFDAGWNGVDFFFVLSGFIITYVHFKDIGKKNMTYSYFLKRVIRIFPSYWIFLTISLAFLILSKREFLSFPYILKCYFLIPQDRQPFLAVAWSLYYEAFFYILFGFYILAGKKILYFGIAAELIIVTINLINPSLFAANPFLTLIGSNYNIEFILGCGVAVICLRNKSEVLYKYKNIFVIIGAALFLFSWYLSLHYTSIYKYGIGSRLFYGVSSSFLILGAAQFKPLIWDNTWGNFFKKVGDASYVLYLSHPIIIALCFKILIKYVHAHTVPLLYVISFLLLAVTLLFSILFYNRLEVPIMTFLKRRFLNKSIK